LDGINFVKKRKIGVFNLVDPIEAIEAFLSKWVVHVLEPRNSNL
jgi:hypothetical protein